MKRGLSTAIFAFALSAGAASACEIETPDWDFSGDSPATVRVRCPVGQYYTLEAFDTFTHTRGSGPHYAFSNSGEMVSYVLVDSNGMPIDSFRDFGSGAWQEHRIYARFHNPPSIGIYANDSLRLTLYYDGPLIDRDIKASVDFSYQEPDS